MFRGVLIGMYEEEPNTRVTSASACDSPYPQLPLLLSVVVRSAEFGDLNGHSACVCQNFCQR